MKAIIYEKYGSPDVLQLKEVEKPIPKTNEILVKVHATTVNAAVVNGRNGKHPDSKFFTFALRLMYGVRKPKKPILGYEWAGQVESVGSSVTLFKEGDKVFGTTTGLKQGSYAEYVCIPEKWNQGVVAIKPDMIPDAEAACIPVAGMAALDLLRKANIRNGQKVLIYGASGSVGSFALQIAKYFGAEVTAVCSTSKLEMVRSLGADKVIDYTKQDFTENGEKYDVIFETVVKISKDKCKGSLVPNGIFLTVKSMTHERTKELIFLADLVVSGKIKPFVDKTYPLEKMVEAHKYVDMGHKKGNVVITVSSQ
jgi:NADPH:quinone reductase-like Zn-dependent oxidoreductase